MILTIPVAYCLPMLVRNKSWMGGGWRSWKCQHSPWVRLWYCLSLANQTLEKDAKSTLHPMMKRFLSWKIGGWERWTILDSLCTFRFPMHIVKMINLAIKFLEWFISERIFQKTNLKSKIKNQKWEQVWAKLGQAQPLLVYGDKIC